MTETKLVKCYYCSEEILSDAKKCKHCNEWVKPTNSGVIKSNAIPKKEVSLLKKEFGLAGWGVLLLVLGICGAVYFGFFFDTSVSVPTTNFMGQSFGGGRINNLGLMQDRQNFLMLSCAVSIIGVLLSLFGSKKK